MERFKDLPLQARFIFASQEEPGLRFSGMARGPWIKISARRYVHVDFPSGFEARHQVGSINVEVIRKAG